MPGTVIQTENLVKHYGKVRAVDGISLEVTKGEIYGFLGLNGAGKTTAIRMLLGMVRPTDGTMALFGHTVRTAAPELWNRVGYMVEIPYSYPELTVRENLDMMRNLRGLRDKAAVDRTINQLRLEEYADRPAGKLSLGNQQRLGLAKAILHQPELLVLDEPANGLDPAGIVEIRELLTDLARNHGVTVFVSSHILGEVARLATRIGIIHNGQILNECGMDELDRDRKRALTVDTRDRKLGASILSDAGYRFSTDAEGLIEITDPQAVKAPEAVAALLCAKGCPPTHLAVREEDLESYFLRVIHEKGGTA